MTSMSVGAASLKTATATGSAATPSATPTSSDLTVALQNLMGSNSDAAGVCSVNIAATGMPTIVSGLKQLLTFMLVHIPSLLLKRLQLLFPN